jgi:hypothetical protein
VARKNLSETVWLTVDICGASAAADVDNGALAYAALTHFATGCGARSLMGGTAHAVDQLNRIVRWRVVAPANVPVRPY